MAIELSPIIAQDIEAAGRRYGLQGILDFFAVPTTWSPMYLREEAQFLAAVIGAAPRNERVLWGCDREIFSDRYLIARIEPKVPPRAREAFTRLKGASANAWAQQTPFLFSQQDPAVVSAVRAACADRESDTILRTLEETLAINAVGRTGTAWDSSDRRARWMRNCLAERLREERGSPPKVLMKFGYNHMIRGANYVNIFDLGAMTDEVAALGGARAFHILVLPGPGSRQVHGYDAAVMWKGAHASSA